ncbi:predicted protein [Naegleria gruberi]|uniref:Predicted protein n=1 Tax=Naegleria gruberi TaxID=5762 RepID=D2V272_NAEGR|nr:uncharacterized protein NAEGRDRAFT_62901 [Naegleria gruberi]EFC49001.1 predicted protein [Naegleria gruberi]|eukprot:XP_002681745.1 predicted protein [Naegleria gruberi strain NEG-M]
MLRKGLSLNVASSLMMKRFCANTSMTSSVLSSVPSSLIPSTHTSQIQILCSSLTQQQIRERKKQKVRRKLPSGKETFETFLEGPEEKWKNPAKEIKDTTKSGLKPAIRELLIIRDNKLSFAGEVVKMQAAKAWRFLASNPPKAVLNTPENRELYKDLLSNPEELAAKRDAFNKRYILQRCVVKMWRKTEGADMSYYWAITKRDVANYVWCVYHIAIKEEDISFPGEQKNSEGSYHPIRKPGYYCVYVDLKDGQSPVLVRVYLPINDKAKTYRGKSVIGYV